MNTRPLDSHKGTFGTVIVVGGCPTMFGAPALSARAALRMGTGLVKFATDAQTLPFAILAEPSATGIALPPMAEGALKALDHADPQGRAVLAIGPGWGAPQGYDWREAFLLRLIAGPRKLVLDADGLNLLCRLGSADKPPRFSAPAVLTPHPGEFSRLAQAFGVPGDPTSPKDRPTCASLLAQKMNAVVLLKGRHTVISDGNRVQVNATGNPVLAAAGMGDVLTGAIASLMAQGMEPFEAACLGAHVHGRAADRWRDAHGERGMLARELADGLGA